MLALLSDFRVQSKRGNASTSVSYQIESRPYLLGLSSKTPIGVGQSAIWRAMPSTSVPRSSACPSTTPCAKSLGPKPEEHTAPIAGVVVARCQFGTLTAKRGRLPPYNGSAENPLGRLAKSKLDQPHHSARSERSNLAPNYDASAGQTLKTLRRQFGTKYDGN